MRNDRNMSPGRAVKAALAIMTGAIICAATAGCAKSAREEVREERPARLFVTWEFSSVDQGGEPYTEAALVINGNRLHRHVIGVFYGRVRKIFKPEEFNRQMIGGTLSGFTTSNEGRGHEVVVRYNEAAQRLVVAERQWSEHLPAAPFGPIKSIPVPDLKDEQTGF